MNATTRENMIFPIYSKAQSELAKGKGRNPASRKVANNTYLVQRKGYIAVRLHATDVVDIHLDKLVLRTGGWMTPTTKDRINRYLPVGWNLYTERRVWWLRHYYHCGTYEPRMYDKWQFKDNISIQQDGWVYDYERSATKMKDRSVLVKEFATEYMSQLAEGKMEAPSNGDCLYCRMHEVGTNRLLGDINQSDHMVSHLEGSYYVPSIIVNALDELGGSPIAKDYVARRFNNIDGGYTYGGLISEQLYRTLVRYISSKVGLGR